MGLIKEFKDFAVKGNMVDMAIGIIIGAAFSTIVDSLVKQIISPPLSLLTGEINFEDKNGCYERQLALMGARITWRKFLLATEFSSSRLLIS